MGAGMIHRLIEVLTSALGNYGAQADSLAIERIAVLVHRVMSYQSRQFHTLDHVFSFVEGADAETVIAAIFHDLIYFQVDDGLPEEVKALVAPYVEGEGSHLRIAKTVARTERAFHHTLLIFGFVPGQELGLFGGLNEFLSALVATRLVGPLIPYASLLEVVLAIEATIPFRKLDEKGRGVGEVLFSRIQALPDLNSTGLDVTRIHRAIIRAIDFSNHDVDDFAMDDPGLFLSNTWKLLPESNASLRRKGAFSIRDYRIALQKMLGFFKSLIPESIFHQFDSSPSDELLAIMTTKAKRNLEFARQYLHAKLLAAGLLEALAELSGGDAPMALFMGDIPHDGGEHQGLVDALPRVERPEWIDGSNAVYRLLRDGRLAESSFDLKESPLALYLYDRLPPSSWRLGEIAVEAYFAQKIDALGVLAGIDRSLLEDLIVACGNLVPGRRVAFASIFSQL